MHREDPFRAFEPKQIAVSFLTTPMVATRVLKCACPRGNLRNERLGLEIMCTLAETPELFVYRAGAWLEAQGVKNMKE